MGTVQNGFDLSQYRGELQSENRIDIAVRVKKLTKMSEEVLRYVKGTKVGSHPVRSLH